MGEKESEKFQQSVGGGWEERGERGGGKKASKRAISRKKEGRGEGAAHAEEKKESFVGTSNPAHTENNSAKKKEWVGEGRRKQCM